MPVMAEPMKCCRTACKRRSADPKGDGWIWMEFGADVGLKTGWWCPACSERVKHILDEHWHRMEARTGAAKRSPS